MKSLTRKQLEINTRDYSTDFSSTEELESLNDVLGQERALKALDFAIEAFKLNPSVTPAQEVMFGAKFAFVL